VIASEARSDKELIGLLVTSEPDPLHPVKARAVRAPGSAGLPALTGCRHGRRRWALLLRRGAMKSQPITCRNPRIFDCLRFGTALKGAVSDVAGVSMCFHGHGTEPPWVSVPCPFQGATQKLKATCQNDAFDPQETF
jgi:hypothetical protein